MLLSGDISRPNLAPYATICHFFGTIEDEHRRSHQVNPVSDPVDHVHTQKDSRQKREKRFCHVSVSCSQLDILKLVSVLVSLGVVGSRVGFNSF
jgi:hypothetical protein